MFFIKNALYAHTPASSIFSIFHSTWNGAEHSRRRHNGDIRPPLMPYVVIKSRKILGLLLGALCMNHWRTPVVYWRPVRPCSLEGQRTKLHTVLVLPSEHITNTKLCRCFVNENVSINANECWRLHCGTCGAVAYCSTTEAISSWRHQLPEVDNRMIGWKMNTSVPASGRGRKQFNYCDQWLWRSYKTWPLRIDISLRY